MSTVMNFLLIASLFLSILPANMMMSPDVFPEIQTGLQSYAERLDEIAGFGEFALPIPMTDKTPAEVLQLGEFWGEVFGQLGPDLIPPEMPFQIGEITVDGFTLNKETQGLLSNIAITVSATKTETLPVSYVNSPEEDPNAAESGTCLDFTDNDGDGLADSEDPDCTPISIEGGELTGVVFNLDAAFNFQFDSSNPDPLTNLYLQPEPTITLTYTFDDLIEPFPSRLGIADVTVSGSARYNALIDTQILDEQADSKITLWDFDNSILPDLIQMAYIDQPDDDVFVNLLLDSHLVSGTEDGLLELVIPDLSVKPQPRTTLTVGSQLESFKIIGPDELLTGLAGYAIALDTAWIVNEGDLPFIEEDLHSLFMPGENLLNLIRRQGDALVLCGTDLTSPPSGTPDPAAAQTVYCQAFTAEQPAAVIDWRVAGGPVPEFRDVNNQPATIDQTVGISPTALAVFTDLAPNAWKNIELEFQINAQGTLETHIAEPRIRTINDLKEKIDQIDGTLVGEVSFDPVSHALIMGISQVIDPELDPNDPDGCTGCIHLAVDDLLIQDTGISNLQDDSTSEDKTMDLGPVTVQAGFGTLLVTNPEVDRHFISVGVENEISVSSLTASIPTNYVMQAAIGALGIDVTVPSFTFSSSPSGPTLTMDINPSTAYPVAQAIGTHELINNPDTVSVVQNLSLNASLNVTSKGLTPNKTGVFNISWPDIPVNWSDTAPPQGLIITSDPAAAQLKAFNIDPANPQVLISSILDAIYERTTKMYNQAETGETLPLVSLSTRDLVAQFGEIIDAVVAIKTGVSDADISCEMTEVEDGIQVGCWAVSDAMPASVSWALNPAIFTSSQNANDPTTIWSSPEAAGTKALFQISNNISEAELDQITVTLTMDGKEIEFPYQPPETVEQLEQALEARLMDVQFNITGSAGEYALQIVLALDHPNETREFLLQLDVQDPLIGTIRLAAQDTNALQTEFSSEFFLDFDLPLVMGAVPNLSFNPETHVSVDLSVEESGFNIDASLGSLQLSLGEQAVLTDDRRPDLALEIQSNPPTYHSVGELVTLTYTITNNGAFTLSGPFNVMANNITVDCSSAPGTLSPGETAACTGAYTISPDDTSIMGVSIEAYAEGWFGEVQLASPVTSILIANEIADPAISLTISVSPFIFSAEGETLTYTYQIENTGNVEMAGPFSLDDDRTGITDPCGSGSLAPGASTSCSAIYVINADDITAQSITNTATASTQYGGSTLTDTAEFTVTSVPDPLLELSVYASTDMLTLGEEILFTYEIKNAGNIPLDGPFTVSDDQMATVCTTSTPASLSPVETAACIANHTVTEADMAAGLAQTVYANAAYDGLPLQSSPTTINLTAAPDPTPDPTPVVELSVNLNPGTVTVGDVIEFVYEIKNTGNVSLDGPFTVMDDQLAEICIASTPIVLLPTEIVTCSTSHMVTQADLDAGEVVFSAAANAAYDSSPVTSLSIVTTLPVTEFGRQSELSFGFTSRLEFQETGWVRVLDELEGSDMHILMGMRSIADSTEKFLGILDGALEISGTTIAPLAIPLELLNELNVEPLDPTLLPLSLPLYGDLLQENLDGGRWGIRVPLVGSDLAAGEDFAGLFSQWSSALSAAMQIQNTAGASDPKQLHDRLNDAVHEAFSLDGLENLVDVYCGDTTCNTSTDPDAILTAVKVNLSLTETRAATGIPFSSGLPGVPLESTDKDPVSSQVDWTLNLSFGLDRYHGPFVSITADNDLQLESSMQIVGDTCETIDVYHGITNVFTASTRCMNAVIGLIPGKLFDGGGETSKDNPSAVHLETIFNLAGGTETPDMQTYAELLDGLGATAPEVNATDGSGGPAKVNLLFVTNSSPIPLPQIAGTIQITYDKDAEVPFAMRYEDIYLNATTFFGGFLGPLVQDAQKYTTPLQPVVDTVNAPLPVLSDLSEMVGGSAISLLSIMEATGSSNLTMLSRFVGLVQFVNDIPADSTGIWIGLGPGEEGTEDESGSFEIETEFAEDPPCSVDDDLTADCDMNSGKEDSLKKNEKKDDDATGKLKPEAKAEWTGAGISMPFLEDPGQIYGMLLGIDATLIRIDLGTLKASAGLEYTYGPIMVGPIPLAITIGGTVTLEGRFAIGYDTRGLHQALLGNGFSGRELLKGIFIDDLDAAGTDVPEIKLEVDIYAGAAISIKIFEAGIRAGVLIGVELNWNDPNKDGKLYFDEIAMWRYRPLCLFDLRGYIGFYLKFYLKIDFFFFTKTYTWTILKKEYDLFNLSCTPTKAVLAQKDVNSRFRLNMGPYEIDRGIPSEGGNEEFTLRQMTPEGEGCADGPTVDSCETPAGTWISVTFDGIYQEYLVPNGYHIYAEAGGGNDAISLLSGTDWREGKNGAEVPFTLDAELYGGDGDDWFDTGAGNDYVDGDIGNDNINTRGGDDILIGGPENSSSDDYDNLDGGKGTDILLGGVGDDIMNGGPGQDVLLGGLGDDSLTGGPGLPPSSTTEVSIQDLTDVLVGGTGKDTLNGSYDIDYLFGDEPPDNVMPPGFEDEINNSTDTGNAVIDNPSRVAYAITTVSVYDCQSEMGGDQADNIIGGDGDDHLFGGGGDDWMDGEKGDDILCGNQGHDTLIGSAGSDFLWGNAGHDMLYGEQGNDYLYGGTEDDALMGGEGSDELNGEEGNDILIGDLGTVEYGQDPNCPPEETCPPQDHPTDTSKMPAIVSLGADPADGGTITYADTLNGGDGHDFLFGETGDDVLSGDAQADYMEGNSGDDILLGGQGSDHMLGGQNNDTMSGGSEDDFMWGNSGDDRMDGNFGSDWMNGNAGNDILFGNEGGDTIYGGTGQDDIIGGSSTADALDAGDTLYGNEGSDRIAGDNAQITASGIVLLNIGTTETSVDPTLYGIDWIEGYDGSDQIWGQGGSDIIYGGGGDDTLEGNGGADTIYGGTGQDDIIGGSSIAGALDSGDTIYGDEGADTILGDNGMIERPGNILLAYALEADTIGDTDPRHIISGTSSRILRTVTMLDAVAGDTSGSDWISGGDGDDEIYGQFDDTRLEPSIVGDELYGNAGQDLLIGDQGVAAATVLQDETLLIDTKISFLEDNIFLQGTLYWEVSLLQPEYVGNDLLSGGDGSDRLHGGGGDDLMNGNAGNDRLFGDDGDDAIWGGQHHDHLYGGYGNDWLDVLPRETDPVSWTTWTQDGSYEDIDFLYGGWGQDALQADQAPKGKEPGDRMMDWMGVYNIFYVCSSQYGQDVIIRIPNDTLFDFVRQLASSDGASDPEIIGSSGFGELGLVLKDDFKLNSSPPHPDTPGNSTCPVE